jgi:hypothetical protein
MNSSDTSVPAFSHAPVAASVEPWQLQANQSDHGETSVVCDAKGLVVCTIPSPVWDVAAVLKRPEDAANARMLVAAPKMLTALREAEKALEVLADEHEQGDDLYKAGGWATDALRVVRKAIRAAEAPAGGVASFRVEAPVFDGTDPRRLAALLCKYGKAKFGDEWWPSNPGPHLPEGEAAELEALTQ